MKIINMAKIGVINEVDMLQALNKGRVGGAAFDVYIEVCTYYFTNKFCISYSKFSTYFI